MYRNECLKKHKKLQTSLKNIPKIYFIRLPHPPTSSISDLIFHPRDTSQNYRKPQSVNFNKIWFHYEWKIPFIFFYRCESVDGARSGRARLRNFSIFCKSNVVWIFNENRKTLGAGANDFFFNIFDPHKSRLARRRNSLFGKRSRQ